MKRTTNPSPNPTSSPKLFGPLRPEPSSLFNRASITTIALVNAIVLAGSADAQSADADSATKAPAAKKKSTTGAETVEVTLDEIVVAAQPETYKTEFLESPKYTAPILDTPQTINVVPQEVIKDQNATTLRDVLRNVPGIAIQGGEGGVSNGDNLTIRGFNAKTDMFVDGIRDMGGYSRDPFNYEQIEVAKGPNSAYTGRGSTGGSVNLVTKTPKLERSYAGSVGIGTDQTTRLTLDLNQPIDALPGTAFRLNTVWQEGDTPGRDFADNSRWGIAPSVAFGLGTETRITLSYLHLEADNQPDNGIPWVPAANVPLAKYANQAPPVDYNTYYGLKGRDYEKVETDIATVEIEHDVNDNLTLRNVFRYGRNDRDSIYTTPRFSNNNSTDIKREFKARAQVTEIIADSISARAKFDTWKFSHTADIGVDFSYETDKNRARATVDNTNGPITDLYHPDAQDRPTAYVAGGPWTGAYNEGKSTSVGVFLFDTIKLHEQLEVSGGVRWDNFDATYNQVAANGTTTSYDQKDNFVSWRIGPVYKPVENGSFYISYGTSFNPSAEGLALSTSTEGVPPEENQTVEIGTKWDVLDNRLSLTAAIFRIEKLNARLPNTDPTEPQQVLEGEQRVDGIELGAVGSITKEWKVYTGFSYLNSKIMKSNDPAQEGRRLPSTPQTSFSLWTTYDLPWNITVGGGGQYVGSRFNDAANLRKADEYWVFDAMVAYKINENLNAQLNITNLTDERYIDQLSGGHFVPGSGRAAMLTLNFKF